MLGTNDTCPMFMIDFHKLDMKKQDTLKLFKYLHESDTSQLKMFSFIAQQELVTRVNGFSIGQVYYVKMFRPKYKSSYFKVIVLSATKNHVNVQSSFKNKTWYGQFLKSSLITEEEYKKLKLPELDPKFHTYSKFVKIKGAHITTSHKRGRKKKSETENILDKMADDLLKNDPMKDNWFEVSSGSSNDYDESPFADGGSDDID